MLTTRRRSTTFPTDGLANGDGRRASRSPTPCSSTVTATRSPPADCSASRSSSTSGSARAHRVPRSSRLRHRRRRGRRRAIHRRQHDRLGGGRWSASPASAACEYELLRDQLRRTRRRHRCGRVPDHAVRRLRRDDRRPDRPDRRGRTAIEGGRTREPRRRRREPVVHPRSRRGGQSVRLHPAADLPDVLPRPGGATARHAAGDAAPGGARQRGAVGRIHGRVPRRRRRSRTTSPTGSTRTRSTPRSSSAPSLLVLGIAMLFGYKLPFTTPEHAHRRHRPSAPSGRCSCSASPTPSPRSAARSGCSSPPCSARRHATGWRPASATSSPTAPAWRCVVSALTIALAFANTGAAQGAAVVHAVRRHGSPRCS